MIPKTRYFDEWPGRMEFQEVAARIPQGSLQVKTGEGLVSALRFFRLIVLFEIRTIAAIVFPFEHEAAVQRSGGNSSNKEKWKKSKENALHNDQI